MPISRAELRTLENLRTLVGQLRREEGIERTMVSEAAADFIEYVTSREEDDKILSKYLNKPNSGGRGPAAVLGRLCSGGSVDK